MIYKYIYFYRATSRITYVVTLDLGSFNITTLFQAINGGGEGRGLVPHFQMLCSDASASPSRTIHNFLLKNNETSQLTENKVYSQPASEREVYFCFQFDDALVFETFPTPIRGAAKGLSYNSVCYGRVLVKHNM